MESKRAMNEFVENFANEMITLKETEEESP